MHVIYTTTANGCHFAKQIKGSLVSTQCKHPIQCHVRVSRICLFLTKQPYKTDYKDVLQLPFQYLLHSVNGLCWHITKSRVT